MAESFVIGVATLTKAQLVTIGGGVLSRNGQVSVPASPAEVSGFVERNRGRYLTDLAEVRRQIEELRKSDLRLRSIYKVYSRGDLQGLDELKSSRKIRLKFNEWNLARGVTQASLFDVPDVVGLTIVVPYPSGIDAVAAAIDAAIDAKQLNSVPMGSSDAASTIITKHGRGLASKGYSACHYNLRIPGAGKRPIVEVQIKTLLHDAWGAKTHDLTYKPSGRIGEELLVSFDLLGSSLANLDQQSDALRTSILRAAEVRERKRGVVQVAVLAMMANYALSTVVAPAILARLTSIQTEIMSMSPEARSEDCFRLYSHLAEIFDEGAGPPGTGVAASTLLCLLAAKTRRAHDFDHAQDILDFRVGAEADPQAKVKIRLDGMLTAFAAGDVPEAIDLGEEIARDIEALRLGGAALADPDRFLRQRANIYSNLAYFHADLAGSHEGDKRGSVGLARSYMVRAKALYPGIGFPPDGLMSPEADIIAAVTDSDQSLAEEAFFAMDNEAYVAIQCADNEDGLRAVRLKLEFLHRHQPASIKHLAELAVDYHDYCARVRLAELESAGASI